MELRLDAEHRYWLGAERLPGVTDILHDVGIVDYSMIAEEPLEAARHRGHLIHLATELDDRGVLDESVAADVMPYVEGWRKFRRDWSFTPTNREEKCHHPIHYFAGTLDAEDDRLLVDIKHGKPQTWVRWQLAAYMSMRPKVKRRVCVHLTGDGNYRPYPFEVATYRTDLDVFLAALTVYRARRMEKNLR